MNDNPQAHPTPAGQPLDRAVNAQQVRFTQGLSPASLVGAYMDWLIHLAASPDKQQALMRKALDKYLHVSAHALKHATGQCQPCIEPLPQDKRFAAPEWQQRPFNLIYQSFLLNQQWWHNATTGVRGVSRHHENMVTFAGRQWLDMWSPSNFIWTNPEVLHAITQGAGKVVGVLDAALDAAQGAQVAQAQALHQYTCFVLRDFRKNCHGRVRQPSELEHVPDPRAGARLGPFALRGARARTLGGLDFVFGHVGLRGDRDALGLAAHPQFVDAGTAVLGADLLDPLVWTTFGGRLCLTRSRCLRQRSPAAPGQHGGGDQGQRAAQG